MACILTIAMVAGAPLRAKTITFGEFLGVKTGIDTRVEKTINREFGRDREALKKLSKPYKIGDYISVNVRRGNQYETVSGRFNGVLRGRYAKISSKAILITDLSLEDQDLVTWNDDPAKLEKTIAERTAELNTRIDRRRRQLRKQEYNLAGYPTKFFEEHIQIGKFVSTMPTAAHRRAIFSVILEPDNDFVAASLRNGTKSILDAVLTIKETPVASSIPVDNPAATGQWQTTLRFFVKRDDLGDHPEIDLPTMMHIYCRSARFGIWPLALRPGPRTRAVTIERFGKKVTAKEVKFLCVVPDDALSKPKDAFALRELRMLPAETFMKLSKAGGSYAAGVAALKTALEAKRQAAWEAELAARARLAAEAKAAAEKAAAEAAKAAAEAASKEPATATAKTGGEGDATGAQPAVTTRDGAGDSATPATDGEAAVAATPGPPPAAAGTPPSREAVMGLLSLSNSKLRWLVADEQDPKPPRDPRRVLQSVNMDNPETPRTLGASAVLNYTKWVRIRVPRRRGQVIDSPHYRLVIAKAPRQDPRSYLQYYGLFTSFKPTIQTIYLRFVFKAGDEERERVDAFTVKPKWSGKIYVTNEMPPSVLSLPLSGLDVFVLDEKPPSTPSAPAAGTAPPDGDDADGAR